MLKKMTQLLLIFSFLFAQSTLSLAFDTKTVCEAAKDACTGKFYGQGGHPSEILFNMKGKSPDDVCEFTRAEDVITRNYGTATVYVNCLSDQTECNTKSDRNRFSSTKGLECSGSHCHNNHNWGTCEF